MLNKNFKEKLFANHILVSSAPAKDQEAVYLTLLGKFGIKVADDASFMLLNPEILSDAEKFIGKPLGQPFYRSFPESVKKLSVEEQIIDRLLHYMQTYGEGDFENRHFSVFEEECEKVPFREKVEKKIFKIVDENGAIKEMFKIADNMLLRRQLADGDFDIIMSLLTEYNYRPEQIASKQVIANILLALRDKNGMTEAMTFIDNFHNFAMNDVLRVLGYETAGKSFDGKPQFKKLNLTAKQRKFYAALIEHTALHCSKEEIRDCVEKRKDWKGLLHHLHFAPASNKSKLLVNTIFDDSVKSAYSEVERLFAEGDYLGSAKALVAAKGSTTLLRHLNRYLFATEAMSIVRDEITELAVNGANPIAKMQFALSNTASNNGGHRIMYDYYGRTIVHEDTRNVRPVISARTGLELANTIKDELARTLPKTDKKFYLGKGLENLALPLWSSSETGLGVMNTGSRVDIPDGKVVRAFVYWEKERDLDLSGILISRTEGSKEFSWRSAYNANSTGVTFSGDVTDGVHGGAEYFDIDLDIVAKNNPKHKYMIFSVNNYSSSYESYKDFPSRAGFMVRDGLSSGEIFEPATVESSFELTADSRMAVMFAIDIEKRQLVWINRAPEGGAIAASMPMNVFFSYLDSATLFNEKWLFENVAGSIVTDPAKADVIVADSKELADYKAREDQTVLSTDDGNIALPYLTAKN